MKTLTNLQRKQQGHDKSSAKGASRKAVAVKGLGIAIADAHEKHGDSVRVAILALIGQNDETVLLALLELEQRRDKRVEECTGERKAKKIASVRVMYSRIMVIVKAIHKKFNLDKIRKATTFTEMYAYASNKAKKADGRNAKPFTEDQFKEWNGKVARIIGTQPGRTAKESERDRFSAQLARLEQHTLDCLGVLSKFSLQTRIPVRDMIGLTAKRKAHLRKAA